VRTLQSSIIVCNHISYLDPILLVSLYKRHTTVVKNTFFRVPIFGWFLEKAGYLPSSSTDIFDPAMSANLEKIQRHLSAGGNLFIFPEGTRGRKGRVLPFNKGVFSIARYCNAELKLVLIRGTDKLFPPGGFSFRMSGDHTISLRRIVTLKPDYASENFSVSALAEDARQIFVREIG
jgi:1-acyl-sn-glycerol-3-phosphate acyltransferase